MNTNVVTISQELSPVKLYEIFWTSAGGAVLGALVSAIVAFWLERILHREHLRLLRESHEAFLASLKRFQDVDALGGESLRKELHGSREAIVEAIKGLKRNGGDNKEGHES